MSAHNDFLSPLPDLDEPYQPSHNERARQGFVSVLRVHADRVIRPKLERYYETTLSPEVEKTSGTPPQTGAEIEKLMGDVPLFRFYSAVRYNAQEMMYQSLLDPVERAADDINSIGKEVRARAPAGGTLTLDEDLPMPGYATALDVHLVPGSFYLDHGPDDIAQGAMLNYASQVVNGGKVHRENDLGSVATSIGYWLTQRYPEFKPKRMLDVGTQSGRNLLGYLDHFPDVEAHGVDIAAPTLRFGHTRAETLGKTVHFSQQNAEQMSYSDGQFDLIVSSFFFHELPLAATRAVLAECRRLLAPGGIMAHMELPPHNQSTAWQNFAWDWDTKYNNEPYYKLFRSQDFFALLKEAGFAPDDCYTTVVPNSETTSADDYARYLSGELPPLIHGRGGWFVFGATT